MGAGLAFIGAVAVMFLVANDVLVYEAATSSDRRESRSSADDQHNVLFGLMLGLYVVGQLTGCVLLAVAVAPARRAAMDGDRRRACPLVGLRPLPSRGGAGRRRLRCLCAETATKRRRVATNRRLDSIDVGAHVSEGRVCCPSSCWAG